MAVRASLNRMRLRLRARGLAWIWASVLLAVVIGILLLVVPLSTSVGASSVSPVPGDVSGFDPGSSADVQVEVERHNLLDDEGWGITGILAIPVALCAAPLLAPSRMRGPVTVGSTVLLAAAVVIGSASIGWFYLPVLLTMVIAASQTLRGRDEQRREGRQARRGWY